MTSPSPEELQRALAAAERRAAELQAWVDSSEVEADQLRARVAELEAAPAPKAATGPNAELQAWLEASEAEVEKLRARVTELEVAPKASAPGPNAELQAWLDASEAEVETLRARVAELEGTPKTSGGPNAELQAWLDASEAEVEKLRARVTELEAAPKASAPGPNAELQAWLDASEAEVEKLRAQVKGLEEKLVKTHAQDSRRADEVKAWLDSSEAENEALREKVAEEEKLVQKDEKQVHELQAWLDASEADNEKLRAQLAEADPNQTKYLRERVSELESSMHSLKELNKRFADQVQAGAQRDVARLEAELDAAKASGNAQKLEELDATLANAREAIATLESERAAAVAQVQRYASRDSAIATEKERRAKAELDGVRQEKDAKIAVLQASLGARESELKTLEQRLAAYVASDAKLTEESDRFRRGECEAREQLAHVRDERDRLESDKRALEHELAETANHLAESKRWLETAEAENEDLEKKLEAARMDAVLKATEATAVAAAASSSASRPGTSAPAAAVPEEDDAGVEGFSVARLRRLEALLSAEQARSANLKRFADTAERSLVTMQDQLELAHGRLKDLAKRLGLNDNEFGEALDKLDASRRELAALRSELGTTLAAPQPPPPPVDAFDDVPTEEPDVLSGPLEAVEAVAESQALATRQATEALQGEQRAREQLMTDLSWLKAELEKLSSVRDDLRTRLAGMVQREVKRKGVVASLLDQLRKSEVAAAARVGALKRLQAAIELAQRNAVRVQTVYFQKQIGSLQRQLEKAMGKKGPSGAPKPLVPLRRA